MDSPMSSSLVEILGTLEDPRVDRTKLHPLMDILVLSVPAVICGADSFVAIALFGEIHEEWLRTFLELSHGIPSHDTLGRVCARLDVSGCEEGFRDWVQEAFEWTDGQVVAVAASACAAPTTGAGAWGPCTWSAPGRRPTAWSCPRRPWTTSPTKSRPSRSCCACRS